MRAVERPLQTQYPDRDLTCRVLGHTGHALFDADRDWGAQREDFIDDVPAWLADRG